MLVASSLVNATTHTQVDTPSIVLKLALKVENEFKW